VTVRCPCGSGGEYRVCCGRLHRGAAAVTAELLMRSRYSAYAMQDAGYLLRTWYPSTRPTELRFEPQQRWTRLEILDRTGGGLLEEAGTVEFRAHYELAGRVGVMHERSRFVRHDGRWTYLGGIPT
jgi:SEC-C motif-containing protein